MPTLSYKPIIFISYAHADEPEKPGEGDTKWLSFVTGYLRPAIKDGAAEIWIDRLTRGGGGWNPETERELRACDLFILLVSPHSLSSDYVVDREVAIIRERQAKGEDVHFYPLLLTPTPKIALELVRDENLRPRDGKPFSDYSISDRYQQMADAADEIAKIAREIASRKLASASQGAAKQGPRELEDAAIPDRDSLAIRLRGQSSEAGVMTAAGEGTSGGVFISYRREDSWFARLICDRVKRRLGRVFFDVYEIKPGGEFARIISQYVSDCGSLVAIIGKGWLTARNRRRLDDPNDFVRIEIGTALARGIPVIPVVEDGAGRPREENLPDALKLLAGLHVLEISHERFDSDAKRLIDALPPRAPAESKRRKSKATPAGRPPALAALESPPAPTEPAPQPSPAPIERAPVPTAPRDEGRRGTVSEVKDRESLKAWLRGEGKGRGQKRHVKVAIAARAALRVLPLAVRAAPETAASQFANLTSAIFRSTALARIVARYPTRRSELRAAARDAADEDVTAARAGAATSAGAAVRAGTAAARAAGAAAADAGAAAARAGAATSAGAAVRAGTAAARAAGAAAADAGAAAAADVLAAADEAAAAADEAAADDEAAAADEGAAAVWEEIRSDVAAFGTFEASWMADAPLWSHGAPDWAERAWADLKDALPKGEDWEVWIEWYKQRLRGGSRGEEYELVFASVPLDLWRRGPAVANAWIREHLP